MDVLITGGAGFIGGHLAEHFAGEGHDVTVLDNLDPYYEVGIKRHNVEAGREAAADSDGSYEFVEGSVTDADTVERLVAGTDVVYHQAAQAGVRTSVENPRKPHEINVDGTLNVLDAARDAGVERVINASSSSVYGKPESLPYDEDHPTEPVSPYGVSKLAAEHYARVYSEVYGLPTVSLRYFTVYGPRMRPNMAFTNFVSRCLHGEPPVIYGDGSQTRDFTYVADVVRANETLLRSDAADGEVLNVGSTTTIDVETLATEIRDRIDPSLELVYGDPREGDAEHTTPTSRRRGSCWATSRRFRSGRGSRRSSTGTVRTRSGTIRWFGSRERSREPSSIEIVHSQSSRISYPRRESRSGYTSTTSRIPPVISNAGRLPS